VSVRRCNQTKYIKKVLSYLAKAALISRSADNDALCYANQIESALECCTKIQEIGKLLVEPINDWFRNFLRAFLEPGTKMIHLLENSHFSGMTIVLILDALDVLREMLANPTVVYTSWIIGKANTKGEYSELVEMLRSGRADYNIVKKIVG